MLGFVLVPRWDTVVILMVMINMNYILCFPHPGNFKCFNNLKSKISIIDECKNTIPYSSDSSSTSSSNTKLNFGFRDDYAFEQQEVSVEKGTKLNTNQVDKIVPTPLDSVINVNLDRRGVIFEVTLGREMGFDIVEGEVSAEVGRVHETSKAKALGIKQGDKIIATSATAGDNMWTHDSADGVKAALNTRFVMSSTVRIRFERSLNDISEEVISKLKIPYYYNIQMKRPLGLHLVEGNDKGVYISEVKADGGADRSRRVEVGDQILAMSASWGDRMWDVSSIDSFIVGVKMRTDSQLSFRLKRMVSFAEFSGTAYRRKRKQTDSILMDPTSSSVNSNNPTPMINQPNVGSDANYNDAINNVDPSPPHTQNKGKSRGDSSEVESFLDGILNVNDGETLLTKWRALRSGDKAISGYGFPSPFSANKAMTRALNIECPDVAITIFEETFGFNVDTNPAGEIVDFLDNDETKDSDNYRLNVFTTEESTESALNDSLEAMNSNNNLQPNQYVCTTAIKAYGRLNQPRRALAALQWYEDSGYKPDVFMMTALLYVCAKAGLVQEAENIFWNEIPARKLSYSVATTNSLMYMYAKLNRPDDALRVYELTKSLGLTCTVVTYGVLIKALIRSGKKPLEESAFDILRSLPSMDIMPTIQVYNQFFEHYAKTHNYRQTKAVLRLMSQLKPRAKPDVVSYGYLIACFAESKKPRSALKVFFQMRRRGIKPNGYTYMGVLKALAHMRDGLSAAQVLTEMDEVGIKPDKKHYSMAMFAGIMAGHSYLVESLFKRFTRTNPKHMPDTALYTLFLRALLQQGKWDDSHSILEQMKTGPPSSRPNIQTLNYMLQYQIRDERWQEAEDTFKSALGLISSYNFDTIVPSDDGGKRLNKGAGMNTMRGVFHALSYGLGSYSTRLQKLLKDDAAYAVKSSADDGLSLSPSAVGLDESDFDVGELGSVGGIGGIKPPLLLKKPNSEAFKFLTWAVEEIAKSDCVILGDFYTELLKALALEGFLSEAEVVLNTGRSGLLRSRPADSVKIIAAEDLALRLLKENEERFVR